MEEHVWIQEPLIKYKVGIDRYSIFFVLMTSVLCFASVLWIWFKEIVKTKKIYYKDTYINIEVFYLYPNTVYDYIEAFSIYKRINQFPVLLLYIKESLNENHINVIDTIINYNLSIGYTRKLGIELTIDYIKYNLFDNFLIIQKLQHYHISLYIIVKNIINHFICDLTNNIYNIDFLRINENLDLIDIKLNSHIYSVYRSYLSNNIDYFNLYENVLSKHFNCLQITKKLLSSGSLTYTDPKVIETINNMLKINKKIPIIIDTNIHYLEYTHFYLNTINSHICYCMLLKPTLLDKRIIACTYNNSIVSYSNVKEYIKQRCIINCKKHKCSDCGFIYENDICNFFKKDSNDL
jgi:hypothetical protein